jgi:hypothetical protein
MIHSLFLGISLKMADEVLDKDIEVQPLYLEIFKCFTVMFLVLSTYNDFPFALSTLISLGFSYLAGGIDDDFWKSFILISILTCIVSFPSSLLALWLIPAVFVMPLIVYGEALIFPEDSSYGKMLGSAAMIPLLILLYMSPIIPFFKERIPESVSGIADKCILFGIGYFLTRTLVKAYIIFKSPSVPIPPIPPMKEKEGQKEKEKESIQDL